MTSFHTQFPRTQYPAYVYTDKLYESHPYNWEQNGSDGQNTFLTLPESECVIPAPIRVWHNNMISGHQPILGDASYPGVVWYPEAPSNTTLYTSYSPPQYFTELMAQNSPVNPSSGSAVPSQNCINYIADLTQNWTISGGTWSSSPVNCVGFAFQVKQTPFAQTGSAGNAQTNLNDSTSPRFRLAWCISSAGTEEATSGASGTGVNDAVYALIVDETGSMQFGYYDNFDTFQIIKKVDYSGGYDAGVKGSYSTGQEYQFFDIMLVGGKMYIGLGGEVVKMVIPDARYAVDGTPIATIVWAEFQSYWSQTCSFSIHPTKFVAEATALSTQFVIGFESNSDPTYDVIPAPGWEDNVREVNVTYTVLSDPASGYDTLLGPTVYYQLTYSQVPTGTWKGLNYTDCPVGVRAVQFYWPRGPIIQDSFTNIDLLAESYTVTQSFDLNSLTIASTAELHFNNWDGAMGAYSQNNGQNATQIKIGKYVYPDGDTDLIPPGFGQNNQVVFTGIGHSAGEVDVSGNAFKYHCIDRRAQLYSPRWALPWMDGWNSLYAIAYLAQQGGVMLEQIYFRDYVPDDPYEDWGDPSNEAFGLGAYFLPVGYFSTQLTRFSGQSLWQMMSAIAQSIGYLLYFDINGELHFEKFLLPFLLEFGIALPAMRNFYESDAQSLEYGDGGDGSENGLTGCWNIGWTKDMSTVRNKVIIVGINAFQPAWQPIVVAETDTDSIDTATALNFLGYNNPYVNIGNQFADPAFAQLACNEILGIFRVPEAKASITTWFQPDIYPLSVINIYSARIGTIGPYAQYGSERFLVTDVSHSFNQTTQVGSTQIRGLAIGQFGNTYADNGNTG